MVVLAACGTPATNPSNPGTPSSATAATGPAKQFWCFTLPADDSGACYEKKLACDVARASMVNSATAPDEKLTICAPQPGAACFDMRQPDGTSQPMCHPTMAMCRDHAEHTSPSAGTPGACVPTDPALARDDVHWWCLSFSTIGSCSRSKVRCEEDRTKALELTRGESIEVSPCASQASAHCFAGDHRSCYPTVETCRSAFGIARPDEHASTDDCRAVD